MKLNRAPLPQAAVRLQHCDQQVEELAPCRSGKRAVTAPDRSNPAHLGLRAFHTTK